MRDRVTAEFLVFPRSHVCSYQLPTDYVLIGLWANINLLCLIDLARRGQGGSVVNPAPLAVPNVTAHPSTASVPITVLLYNDPLICGFNMLIKGLNQHCSFNSTGWLIKTSPIFCRRKDSYSKPRAIGHCLHFAYLSCQWRHPRRHWEILDRHTCIINLSLLLVSEWL